MSHLEAMLAALWGQSVTHHSAVAEQTYVDPSASFPKRRHKAIEREKKQRLEDIGENAFSWETFP